MTVGSPLAQTKRQFASEHQVSPGPRVYLVEVRRRDRGDRYDHSLGSFANGHVQQYKLLDVENKAIPAKKDQLEKGLEGKLLWRSVRNTWIVVLGTLGELKGTLPHNWLAQRKYSVRDVETWALAAWKGLFVDHQDSFEHDVNLRAKTEATVEVSLLQGPDAQVPAP